jgi:hypothetical protein
MATTTDKTIKHLYTSDDWKSWSKDFQLLSHSVHLWDKVNPLTAPQNPWLAMPVRPIPPQLNQFPRPNLNVQPTSLTDLTPAGRTQYNDAITAFRAEMDHYKYMEDDYTKQDKNKKELVQFVLSTVSSYLKDNCCLTTQTISQWYTNLQLEVGVNPVREQELARNRYRACLSKPITISKWDIWLTEYNQAVTEAEVLQVPEVINQHAVLKDFCSAVMKSAPTWATHFLGAMRTNQRLTRREMTQGFREQMEIEHPLNPRPRGGAYGVDAESTFAGSGEGNTNQDSNKRDASAASRNPRTRQRARGNGPRTNRQLSKRPHDAESPHEGSTSHEGRCPACMKPGHSISKCWYIDDTNAPSGWNGNKELLRSVRQRLINDTEFQGAVRAASRPRSKTPAIKTSHTPMPEIFDNSD